MERRCRKQKRFYTYKVKAGISNLCVSGFTQAFSLQTSIKPAEDNAPCEHWMKTAFPAQQHEQKGADLPEPHSKAPKLITFLQDFDKLIRNVVFVKRV